MSQTNHSLKTKTAPLFLVLLGLILLTHPAFAQNPAQETDRKTMYTATVLSIYSLDSDSVSAKISDTGYGFGLYMDIESIEKSMAALNNVNVKGQWAGHHLTAVYQYEKKEFELGFGSSEINKFLPGKMIMELKANPQAGDAAVLFSIKL